jgi:molybdate transport system ATP-binding protein
MESGQILGQGSLREISLSRELRSLVGSDAVGAVVDGVVTGIDKQDLTELQLGHGTLRIWLTGARIGDRVRVQLLARDLILATAPPHGLSVQNALEGTVVHVLDDDGHAKLVDVDVGGVRVLSRVTHDAVASLSLRIGLKVWVLVKAVSTRGRAFRWTKST